VVERNKKRKEFLRIREEEEKIKRKGILFLVSFTKSLKRCFEIFYKISQKIFRDLYKIS